MERVKELLEKKILTVEELEELEGSPEVTNVENNGHSGIGDINNLVWYTITVNGEEYSVYAE